METRMLIAGGGTGGHLFPGMAVAEELLARGPEHKVLFVGTEHGIEAKRVPQAGYDFAPIRSAGIAGKGVAGKIKGASIIPLSLWDAIKVTRKFRPQIALGVGGYVSGPAILAARIMGVKTAIHEQNAAPGWTNRILASVVSRVFISFEQGRPFFKRADKKGRVAVSGNPVRKKIVRDLESVAQNRSEKAPGSRTNLLVVGGSQGAHGLNQLVLEAMAELGENDRARVRMRHQTGAKDKDVAEGKYKELGMEAEVREFIEDMAGAYLEADLVVSRSGAGAVAEIALANLPSILVPFPFAAADHQAKNAEALVKSGAARMFREGQTSGKQIADALLEIMNEETLRRDMAQKAAGVAMPRAAACIVDGCLALIKDGSVAGENPGPAERR